MYDALKGFKEALAAKEVIPEERRIITEERIEELNRILLDIRRGSTITVVYYCSLEHCYRQLTGPVTKLDSYWKYLQLGEVCVDLADIYEILA